ITPPMPSVVVRILVAEGDRVESGQGLVVVSAMKMENTLVAPYKGLVKKINTRAEARVAPGDTLVEIEKEAPTDG
ncbi:MAG: biotin/lipoyl-containing protein, partial [Desulfatiglandaceae bacterium]